MEQIMITKPDGSVVPMASKSTATAIKSAKQTWELLGNDVVNINVESPFSQTYGIGDRISVFGRVYQLNRLPKVNKTGMHAFSYDLEFEGVQYDLMRATYDLTIDTTNNQLQDVQADSLTGNLANTHHSGFADVLISNANRVFPGAWVLGTYPETEYKTLTFGESDNCLSVLKIICSEFNVEFEIVQSDGVFTINFVEKIGQTFPTTFQFGKGKGLYSLDRQNVDSSNIVTRLKVYGSTSNITHKYRAARLCLPGKSKGQSYIENAEAVAKYGIYEATKYFDDIKPTFNGTVTGLVSGTILQFVDTNMFDLNESDANGTKYLLPGISAKIHFNTGNLAGYEFDVHSYDHATHTFSLVKIKDERGDEFPSDTSPAFQFAVGDEYKILDVALPPEYETAAENKLLEAGNSYYEQNSQPKVQYGLSVTKAYLQKYVGNGTTVNIFAPGDYIPIKDNDIDVDKSVRIKSLTRNLLDEYEYELSISDTVTTNIKNRVISELIDLDKIVAINNLKDPARARNNWRNSQELLNMVFDPEGDYYTDKIKPASIDTVALSVGAKSMQFGLTNTVFQPNYQGDKNVIKVSGGVLTHYTIDSTAARSWTLADNTTTFDSDSQAYYIYAKCERSGTGGSIIFSTAQIKVEQDANYYHFWIGVVNSVDTALQARSLALSYGFTMINGRYITTGRIQSADGTTYFDLDNSEIGGNIKFVNNGNYEDVGENINTIRDYIDNELYDELQALQDQIDGHIESFFHDYDPSLSNLPASEWATDDDRQKHLNDTFTNTSTGASWRFLIVDGVYQWVEIADTATSQALALAGQAKDTADGKRRVFTTTPITPYDIGDLWAQGVGGEIMRCTAARASGSYVAADWEKASKYDNTVTTINGGIITSGTIQLAGDDTDIKAGITGSGTVEDAVRIWAGETEENKENAPFRVLQDGSVIASKATIEGTIIATSGIFSGFVKIPFVRFKDGATQNPTTLEYTVATNFNLMTGGDDFDFTTPYTLILPNDVSYVGAVLNVYDIPIRTSLSPSLIIKGAITGAILHPSKTTVYGFQPISQIIANKGGLIQFICVQGIINSNNVYWMVSVDNLPGALLT